jgi:hypothetical protein
MASQRPAHDEAAWAAAKKICRLTARQVEMARALGVNPRKLPRLRPSPQERCNPRDEHTHGREPRSRRPSTTDLDADVPERGQDPACQLSDLACYLMNLADDLQKWLAHGSIDPEVLPQVREELREIAKALDTGAPISPIPAIPLPPRPTHRDLSRRGDQERAFDDDEIPF